MTSHALSDAALYRLLTWMSPSYPVGAYTYSHGLEAAVDADGVETADAAEAWIADVVAHGGGFADAVFLLEAHAAAEAGDAERLAAANELALAFAPSQELLMETASQGAAFLAVTLVVGDPPPLLAALGEQEARGERVAYPVVVGCGAAEAGVAADAACLAYLHAFAANLVSACLRLAPVGQVAGQTMLARLEPVVAEAAARAGRTPPDALGLSTIAVDIASMRHETQYTRIFRS